MSGNGSGGVNTVPVNVDAANRAWRTFWQAFLLDVGATVFVALATLLTDLQWTREYWVAVGLAVAKSVVLAVVSYGVRKMVKPAGAVA